MKGRLAGRYRFIVMGRNELAAKAVGGKDHARQEQNALMVYGDSYIA